MNWIPTQDVKPHLIPMSPETKVAYSEFVLGAFYDEVCDIWHYEITQYRRGGRGDDIELYWGGFEGEPIYWADIEPPNS